MVRGSEETIEAVRGKKSRSYETEYPDPASLGMKAWKTMLSSDADSLSPCTSGLHTLKGLRTSLVAWATRLLFFSATNHAS